MSTISQPFAATERSSASASLQPHHALQSSVRRYLVLPGLAMSALALTACGSRDSRAIDAALRSDLAMAAAAPGARSAYASPVELGYQPQMYGYPAQAYGYPPQAYGYPPQAYGYPPQPYAYPPQPYGYPQPAVQQAPAAAAQQVVYRAPASSGSSAARGSGSGSGSGAGQATERNTQRGAIIGAATGAAVGIATQRDKVKGGAVGAVTGAVLGGVVGSQIYTKPRQR